MGLGSATLGDIDPCVDGIVSSLNGICSLFAVMAIEEVTTKAMGSYSYCTDCVRTRTHSRTQVSQTLLYDE